MPRKRKEEKGRKKQPSLDAVMVWMLHKDAPLRYDQLENCVADSAGLKKQKGSTVLRKKVKYDYLRMLLHEEIVRKLVYDHEEWYALFDYGPKQDIKVLSTIEEYIRVYGSWPSKEQIAQEVGIAPREAERIAYKLAPLTGWSTATPEGTDYRRFLRRLELAAWLKNGCAKAKFVREHWTRNDIRIAEALRSRYPDLVPALDVFRFEGESKDVFHYSYVWPPDSPLEISLDAALHRVYDASRADFRGCTGLRIQKRDKAETGPLSIAKAGETA
jgi:hypothetical protein